MGAVFVLVIQLLIAYWMYNDARKLCMPPMRILLWALGSVMIPMPAALLVVLAYYFIGRKGYERPQRDNNTIDVQAEVLPDEKTEAELQDSSKAEKHCRMCGNVLTDGQTVCPKCNTQN